jgi:hypothetical protein
MRPCVSTCNIFQSNLRIAVRNFLNCSLAGIHRNLHIVVRSSLNYPSAGIRHNLCIVARSSLNSLPVGIRHTLFLSSSNVPLSSKMVLADVWVL